jgi:hypothetical protein
MVHKNSQRELKSYGIIENIGSYISDGGGNIPAYPHVSET